MIGEKTLKQLEFDKVLEKAAKFSVLNKTREAISALRPETDYNTAVYLLDKTDEAFRLLYNGGVGGVEFFDDLTDEPERAARGGILSFSELLRVARLLRAARITARRTLPALRFSVFSVISTFLGSFGSLFCNLLRLPIKNLVEIKAVRLCGYAGKFTVF